MIARLRRVWDTWAVVWWPARASTPALLARYRELALALRVSRVRGPAWPADLLPLAEIGPIARELDRRRVDAGRGPT